jgi:hypothetical protein
LTRIVSSVMPVSTEADCTPTVEGFWNVLFQSVPNPLAEFFIRMGEFRPFPNLK